MVNCESIQNRVIVSVLGMHRSGTSLVTRLLNLMGVFLGDEDELMGGNEFNERGFWENTRIVSLNDSILQQLGGSWHDPPEFTDGWEWNPDLSHLRSQARALVQERFDSRPMWGWKDPRTCLTLPFWSTVVEPTHFVVCVRNPLEVASSVMRAHHTVDSQKAIKLWVTYVSAALRHTSGRKRMIVFYEDIIQRPDNVLAGLAHFIVRPELVHDPMLLEQIRGEVADELRHHRASVIDVIDHSAIPFAAQSLYALLRCAIRDGCEIENIERFPLPQIIDIFSIRAHSFLCRSTQYEQQIAAREAQFAAQIADYEQRLTDTTTHYEQQIAVRERHIAELEYQISKIQADKQAAQRQASTLQAELNRERSGIGYKMLRRIRVSFTNVFPHNSVQRSMYVAVRRTVSRMRAQSSNQTHGYHAPLPATLTMRSNHAAYDQWLAANVPSVQELLEQYAASKHLRMQPLISVIMPVYNVSADLLTRAVESVIAQSYPKWELCVVDDCSSQPHIRPLLKRLAQLDNRIRVAFAEQNRGIAVTSNKCLAMARGDFVVFLDNDDELAPHALFSLAELLSRHPDADLVYSDEDKIAPGNTREQPFFKPDFSYDMLLSINYICHMLALRRSLVEAIGGFREGYDGAQDYDLVLRAVERTRRNRIHHIPDILYHWRITEGSTAANYLNKPGVSRVTLRLLDEHLTRMLGEGYGEVEFVDTHAVYRTRYTLRWQPLVSIIIGTKDKVDVLDACVASLAATTYAHYEVVIINNNSCESATLSYLESIQQKHDRVRVIDYPHTFNYSALNNFGIRHARGDVIVLLNNDTELLTPNWLDVMLGYAQQQRVGCVGVKLLYPDNTIQHAGVIVGLGGVAGHSHKYFPAHSPGYANMLNMVRNYSAVTGACMMFRRAVWEEVGGLDERLAVAFNDVDFCLRIGAAGYDIVYLPHVQLLHYESISIGRVHLNERVMDPGECEYMLQRWKPIIDDDPFYNPNLTLDAENYAIHPIRWRQMRKQRPAKLPGCASVEVRYAHNR